MLIIGLEYGLMLVVAMITFSAYHSLRVQQVTHAFNPNHPAAREVAITVEIIHCMSLGTDNGQLFAIVFPLYDDHRRIQKKERIFLSAQSNKTLNEYWHEGTQLRLVGLHRYFSHEDLKKPFYQRLSHKRIYSKITHSHSMEIIPSTPVRSKFFQKLNTQLQSILSLGAPENTDTLNIYLAMLLGEKEQLLYGQKLRFMQTGTMHLFAVSGLHIGIMTLFIAQLLSCFRIPRTVVPLLTLPIIFIFIQTIGCPPSAMRAFIMITIFWMSLFIKRQTNAFSALVLSALIILCIDPWQIHSLGFQLSYTVVSSILLLGLPLNQWAQSHYQLFAYLPKEDWTFVQKVSAQISSVLIMLFSISFSAWIGSLAICLEVFGYVSTSGIIANILLIQIASLVIVTGMSSLILGLNYLSNLSEFMNHAAWLLLYGINSVLAFLQTLPFPVFKSNANQDFPALWVIVPYFSALFLWHTFPRLLKGYTIWIPPLIVILNTCVLLLLQ